MSFAPEGISTYMPLCHAKKILVKPGDQPALGELFMIAATRASRRACIRTWLYRVEYTNAAIHILDQNDAEGSFDPSLFFTGIYALDHASTATLIKSVLRYSQYRLGFL